MRGDKAQRVSTRQQGGTLTPNVDPSVADDVLLGFVTLRSPLRQHSWLTDNFSRLPAWVCILVTPRDEASTKSALLRTYKPVELCVDETCNQQVWHSALLLLCCPEGVEMQPI